MEAPDRPHEGAKPSSAFAALVGGTDRRTPERSPLMRPDPVPPSPSESFEALRHSPPPMAAPASPVGHATDAVPFPSTEALEPSPRDRAPLPGGSSRARAIDPVPFRSPEALEEADLEAPAPPPEAQLEAAAAAPPAPPPAQELEHLQHLVRMAAKGACWEVQEHFVEFKRKSWMDAWVLYGATPWQSFISRWYGQAAFGAGSVVLLAKGLVDVFSLSECFKRECIAHAISKAAQFNVGIMCALVAVLGFRKHVNSAKWCFVFGLIIVGISMMMDGIVRLGIFFESNALISTLVGVGFLISSIFFAAADKYIHSWLLPLLAAFAMAFGIPLMAMGSSPEYSSRCIPIGLTMAVVHLLWQMRRRFAPRRAHLDVADDKAAYDAAWDMVISSGKGPLYSLAKMCSQAGDAKRPRQLQESGKPLQDLGRLFFQAEVVDGMFAEKIKSWAHQSGGEFKAAAVKSHKRATEKMFQAYGGDASRMLDLSRGQIVFRSVDKIVTCVDLLLRDPDVVCERLINRLDPGYDSTHSAGYRNVCLNLRLVSQAARALGVDLHVVELQLSLDTLVALMSEARTERYKNFRNLRGMFAAGA